MLFFVSDDFSFVSFSLSFFFASFLLLLSRSTLATREIDVAAAGYRRRRCVARRDGGKDVTGEIRRRCCCSVPRYRDSVRRRRFCNVVRLAALPDVVVRE